VNRRFYRGQVALPKGRKRRTVPLSRELAQMLWTMLKDRHAADDELVWISHAGLRVDQSNVMSRVLKPATRKAGIGDWPGFHAFRHTAATRLFRRGWNAVQVQRFLGHSDPGFTLRTYVHLLADDLPEPDFAAGVSTKVSTSDAETGREAEAASDTKSLQSQTYRSPPRSLDSTHNPLVPGSNPGGPPRFPGRRDAPAGRSPAPRPASRR
jgi:hypothetical protein